MSKKEAQNKINDLAEAYPFMWYASVKHRTFDNWGHIRSFASEEEMREKLKGKTIIWKKGKML
jgi:hypothetical protein